MPQDRACVKGDVGGGVLKAIPHLHPDIVNQADVTKAGGGQQDHAFTSRRASIIRASIILALFIFVLCCASSVRAGYRGQPVGIT